MLQPERQVLHSWKEIATYMGLGVRTVQRYECGLGFPIRRPAGKKRSSVLALSDEIDDWLESRASGRHTPPPAELTPIPASLLRMAEEYSEIRTHTQTMRELMAEQRGQIRKIMARLDSLTQFLNQSRARTGHSSNKQTAA